MVSPFLPFMAIQGRKIKRRMPDLPEAAPPYRGMVRGTDRTIRILGLGESTIAGVGVGQMSQSMTAHIARHLQNLLGCSVEWNVVARSGFTADKVREELVPLIPPESFDLLVIGLGGNDTFQLNSPGRWGKDIQRLLNSIRQVGHRCPIVFMNVPPVHEFPIFPWYLKLVLGRLVRLHGKMLQAIIPQHQDTHYMKETIQLEKMKQKVPYPTCTRDYFSDGVHPSELTYRLWAGDVADFIVRESVLG